MIRFRYCKKGWKNGLNQIQLIPKNINNKMQELNNKYAELDKHCEIYNFTSIGSQKMKRVQNFNFRLFS